MVNIANIIIPIVVVFVAVGVSWFFLRFQKSKQRKSSGWEEMDDPADHDIDDIIPPSKIDIQGKLKKGQALTYNREEFPYGGKSSLKKKSRARKRLSRHRRK
jgi:hypothetical protein